jgi:hypothetical protein
MEVINYYAKYSGDYKNLFVWQLEGFSAWLTDFEFEYDNKLYKIRLGGKGDCGQLHRFNKDGKSYVTDNVWYSEFNIDYNLENIYKDDIKDTDIVLNDLSFIPESKREEVKQYFINMINKEKLEELELQKAIETYWRHREVILRFTTDCDRYIYYVVKTEFNDEVYYETYHTHESILYYFHAIGDDYRINKYYNVNLAINDMIKHIDDIFDNIYYATPISISCHDKEFKCVIENRYSVKGKRSNKKDLPIMWSKEPRTEYYIYHK